MHVVCYHLEAKTLLGISVITLLSAPLSPCWEYREQGIICCCCLEVPQVRVASSCCLRLRTAYTHSPWSMLIRRRKGLLWEEHPNYFWWEHVNVHAFVEVLQSKVCPVGECLFMSFLCPFPLPMQLAVKEGWWLLGQTVEKNWEEAQQSSPFSIFLFISEYPSQVRCFPDSGKSQGRMAGLLKLCRKQSSPACPHPSLQLGSLKVEGDRWLYEVCGMSAEGLFALSVMKSSGRRI